MFLLLACHAPTPLLDATWTDATGVDWTASLEGVSAERAEGGVRLWTESIGRGARLVPFAPDTLAAGTRSTLLGELATWERSGTGAVEWFAPGEASLAHGWALEERPEGEGDVVIEVRVDGAEVVAQGDTELQLQATDGTLYRYAGLEIVDADGAELAGALEATAGGLRVVLDDTDARYPLHVDPVMTSVGVYLGAIGYGTEDVGDVNGDGLDEYVVQVCGDPRLVYGVSGGPSYGTYTTMSDPAAAAYCRMDAAGGDFNGDGYNDIVAGGWDLSNNGSLSIYYGSATGLVIPATTTLVYTTTGGAPFSYGYAVDTGDVNGDGYDDIVTGGESVFYLYKGSASGVNPTPIPVQKWIFHWGYEFEAGGDYNGDGYDDVVMGATGGPGGGDVVVWYGSAVGLYPYQSPMKIDNPLGNGLFGNALDSGDFNGDGYDELLAGARDYNTNAGAAFLFQGSATGLSTSAAYTETGGGVGHYVGLVVAFLGDTNLDGRDDFALSSVFDSNNGTLRVYDGSSSGVGAPSTTLTGNGLGISADGTSAIGANLQGPGDMNGDGRGDLAAGAIVGSSTIANYLFWGQ